MLNWVDNKLSEVTQKAKEDANNLQEPDFHMKEALLLILQILWEGARGIARFKDLKPGMEAILQRHALSELQGKHPIL
jgi:hypothetical protein